MKAMLIDSAVLKVLEILNDYVLIDYYDYCAHQFDIPFWLVRLS